MTPTDAMSAEFATVATWTAQAARELGREFYVPAGCRGSGGPVAMDWLLDRLIEGPGQRLLDVGAGVGGPAGYARARRGVEPVLVEPEFAACRAASLLFGFPSLCASATEIPVRTASYDAVWSLGVLCTVPDQVGALREFTRVLTPTGRLGLVVYTATQHLEAEPEGNDFPLHDGLAELLAAAGLRLRERQTLGEFADASSDWQARQDAVQRRVEAQHGHEDAWKEAVRQEGIIGDLLGSGQVIGEVLIAVPAG